MTSKSIKYLKNNYKGTCHIYTLKSIKFCLENNKKTYINNFRDISCPLDWKTEHN